ncbi:major facilitator superfamily domain-containing protein [Suillus subalutaceus]|uniref:major facilitator superfamily domain-containing protein n=1 Tax=Suillus subalutaceus TaxID=48586 RepID=UPI001B8680EF|nr:major facilitator superfamily domain-containing protein [Suillus subalutaceus]KAG1831189.1 major facilitator superfamily domain-containing protein [Suillus subalutaceus]
MSELMIFSHSVACISLARLRTSAIVVSNTFAKPSKHSVLEQDVEPPYSIFTTCEKWLIVTLASVAGLFSPLTAYIYLPAISMIATAFDRTVELTNLTVTVYLVFQAPMFWGTLADRMGRRPTSLGCLFVLSLACIGLAFVPTSYSWLLMVLRCLQAVGSASTLTIGAGIIADIATLAERGGFFGIFTMGPQVGPAIGTVVGGALADKLGWRSIFWFLCISSSALGVRFLPETLRSIVGNGSVFPPIQYHPLLPLMGRCHKDSEVECPPARKSHNPFRLFAYVDVLNLLAFNGIQYAVFTAILATISSLFEENYPHLTETDIGICHLAPGGGLALGAMFSGKLMDLDYRTAKERLIRNLTPEKGIPGDIISDVDFPIEATRLKRLSLWMIIFCAACTGYGLYFQARTTIAVPLVLQFNNLIRCSMRAFLVSVIDLLLCKIDAGWTFVLLGGICLISVPLVWLAVRTGPSCRAGRCVRQPAS